MALVPGAPSARLVTTRAALMYWSRNDGDTASDAGDVVEAVGLVVLGQHRRRVDLAAPADPRWRSRTPCGSAGARRRGPDRDARPRPHRATVSSHAANASEVAFSGRRAPGRRHHAGRAACESPSPTARRARPPAPGPRCRTPRPPSSRAGCGRPRSTWSSIAACRRRGRRLARRGRAARPGAATRSGADMHAQRRGGRRRPRRRRTARTRSLHRPRPPHPARGCAATSRDTTWRRTARGCPTRRRSPW